MTFWEHFFQLLPRKPLSALSAAYEHLTRRKVRARNRLSAASADLPFVYAAWMRSNERDEELTKRCESILQDSDWHPSFCVILYSTSGHSNEQLEQTRGSIEHQNYPLWTIARGVDLDAEIATDADFIVPLRIGDQLSTAALFRFAEAARANRGASILYGDEDYLDQLGRRHRPWFKPLWNREMFLALDYLSKSAAIRASLGNAILREKQPNSVAALMLATTSRAEQSIVHIPHILCHVDATVAERSDRLAIVAEHVEQLGATCSAGPYETIKVTWPLPDPVPLVSIIIPTRDKLELLRACVETLLKRTDYANFEILIVDNESVEERTRVYLSELAHHPRVRVLNFSGPFNFSAINNFAARNSAGSFLCLLNNDTEVVDPAWLAELMRYAVRVDIGAAGAKLLYEDGSIQHAGIVVGIGAAAGHAHRFLPAGQPGYFRMPHVTHYVSAVTAACLVIEKSKFDAVGGLDEEIAVAFNDVDFCLRLQAEGWRNVCVPHAVLVHHESKSRGRDEAPENIDRFRRELTILQRRWGTETYVDPLHHLNLDRRSETFVIHVD